MWIFTSRVITHAAIIRNPGYRKSLLILFTYFHSTPDDKAASVMQFSLLGFGCIDYQALVWFNYCNALLKMVLENNLFNVNTAMAMMT